MKASILQSIWIILKSVSITIKYCSEIIYKSFRGTLTRAETDRYILRWSEKLLNNIQLKFTVHNPNKVELNKDKRYILMSNHASLYDHPIIFAAFPPSIRKIGKVELFRIPLFGRTLTAAEFISIDRKNRHQAIKDLQRAREKMEEGVHIWISPEGTRSHDGKLGQFKKGGFITAIQSQ